MELREFIVASLVQIAKAVVEADDKLAHTGGCVNPKNVMSSNRADGVFGVYLQKGGKDCNRIVDVITFDVAVSTQEGKETQGGIGILAGAVSLGAKGKSEDQLMHESRLQFRIPMLLPNSRHM
jgi:hypothetical protein